MVSTFAIPPASLRAQVGQPPPTGFGEVELESEGLELEETAEDSIQQTRPISAGALLDRPIDRLEYIVGPGDVLTLAIFGFRSQIFNLNVTPEATVVVPAVGVVQVGGRNLEQAEQEVARHVRRFYQDVEVSLSLAAIRSFKIFLVGDVFEPGVREATPITRVSELISPANDEGVLHRNVLIRQVSGAMVKVDLARFLQLGELEHNPTVRDGDVIQVPTIDETVSITGQVAFPGIYEFRQGETLAELVRLANGGDGFRSDAADSLRILRFADATRGIVRPIAAPDAAGAVGEDLELEPFDAIFVPRIGNYKQPMTAMIEGEVTRPGPYPIEPDVTTVRDLVEMAGGFTPRASLVDAVLRREPIERRGGTVELATIPPELLSEDDRRILEVTRRSDGRNVVMDFGTLFAEPDAAYDLPLVEGDVIHVPEFRNQVTVLGAVTEPGIVKYDAGRSLEYFVELAGGYSQRADVGDVVVMKARFGNQVHRDDNPLLEAGDRIIVPFRPERTLLERMQMTQSVITTISGFVLTVIGLERIWDRVSN